MSSSNSLWSPNAERRAKDSRAAPADEPRPQPALTRREARVRRILLRELQRMNEWKRLTYSEKQHLEKRLDVEWIDREVERFRKHIRWSGWIRNVSAPIVAGMFGLGVYLLVSDNFAVAHIQTLISPLYLLGPIFGMRALRRKIFIYEALRELSDADEIDVVLDRSVRDADELIRRIVDRELEIEDRLPLRALISN